MKQVRVIIKRDTGQTSRRSDADTEISTLMPQNGRMDSSTKRQREVLLLLQ